MRVGEVPGDRSARPSVCGLWGLAAGEAPSQALGEGELAPGVYHLNSQHCFTWVFSSLPPTTEVGNLKESVLKFFISSKLSGTEHSPFT